MWDCVTAVDESYKPILYEGSTHRVAIITNAGPGPVEIRAYDETRPGPAAEPVAKLHLNAGNMRAVGGALIRAQLATPLLGVSSERRFAALGWRIEP